MTARLTLPVLGLLALFTAWSVAGMQLASAAALALFLATRGWRDPATVRPPVLAFAAVAVVSVLCAELLGRFDPLAWRFVLLVWIVAALGARLPRADLEQVAWLWIAGAAAASAWAVLQTFTGLDLLALLHLRAHAVALPSPWPGHFAALGFFSSRLNFANGLLLPLGLALGYAVSGSGRQRWLGAGAAGVLGAALLLSFTRAAWWGALVAGGVVLARRAGLRGLLVLAAVVAAAALTPSVRARFASSLRVDANTDRVFIWSRAREVIRAHPVLGVGFGAYPRAARPFYDRADPAFPMHTWAHDTWLSLLAETGPAGVLLFAWLWLVVFRAGRRAAKRSPAAQGLLAGLLGLHVAALFHDVLYAPEVVHALYLGAGLLVAFAGAETSDREPGPGVQPLEPALVPGAHAPGKDQGPQPRQQAVLGLLGDHRAPRAPRDDEPGVVGPHSR